MAFGVFGTGGNYVSLLLQFLPIITNHHTLIARTLVVTQYAI